MTTHSMIWQWVIEAGKPSNQHNISITPAERGVAYGDGFFTTMGVRCSKILWQKEHKQRLQSHLQALCMYLSDTAQAHLWTTVTSSAKQIEEGILKLVITRQPQTLRGYAFAANPQDNVCHVWMGVLKTSSTQNSSSCKSLTLHKPLDPICPITALIHPAPIQPAITAVCLEAKLACLPPALVGLKTLNRLDNVLAAGELERHKIALETDHDFDIYKVGEGLVSDVSGQWVEGVMSNVFYQLKSDSVGSRDMSHSKMGQWYTPPIDRSGVDGVMRQVIIDRFLTADNDITLIERRLQDEDLSHIQTMFFCNAVRGIVPVAQLVLPNHRLLELCLAPF